MTVTLRPTKAGLAEAAALLRQGELVAFGTETVYGLGARADDDRAIAAIYAAKGRPAHNPLICHYPCLADAAPDILVSATAARLAEAFWPGPLTLVLPRHQQSRISRIAGGGLDTIAIRVPAHPIARLLLQAAGVPIAAPSANLSGRVSPTTAAHVLEGLSGRIAAVLDCGPCNVGLESTVLDLSTPTPVLLRQGGIEAASLVALLGRLGQPDGTIRSPGQLAAHYAPSLPLRLNAATLVPNEALLAFGPPLQGATILFQLSAAQDLAEAAHNLFAGLRLLDRQATEAGLHALAAMPIPLTGLGAAINDRLRRAAHRTGIAPDAPPALGLTP